MLQNFKTIPSPSFILFSFKVTFFYLFFVLFEGLPKGLEESQAQNTKEENDKILHILHINFMITTKKMKI